MATSKKGGWSDAPAQAPLSNPFAALAALRPVDAATAAAAPAAAPATKRAADPKLPARAVVAVERKGRGGKTVTLVTHLGLTTDQLDAWVTEMKRSLGCGGTREDDAIALQGDQRERAIDWLTRKGVRKVSG
jgi:translation initiation factor 1